MMHDALVWQLVDSAFPTGAFAHSLGLESAWQHGEVMSRDDLRRFVEATILQAASGALPLVNAAHREPSRLAELDALNDAFLTNAVANRASRQQGRIVQGVPLRQPRRVAMRGVHQGQRAAGGLQDRGLDEAP